MHENISYLFSFMVIKLLIIPFILIRMGAIYTIMLTVRGEMHWIRLQPEVLISTIVEINMFFTQVAAVSQLKNEAFAHVWVVG